MNVVRLLLCVGVSAGSLLLGACGKSEDAPPRYNQRLGDGPDGAPLGAASVDLGILQDQSSYQPANFTSLPGAGGSAATADSKEQAAVRQRMGDLLTAVLDHDFDAVLDAFNPDQVATLDEHVSAMHDTVTKYQAFKRTLQEKMTGQPGFDLGAAEAFDELAWKYIRKAVDVVVSALTVEVADEENAAVGIDLPKLIAAMGPLVQEFQAELAQNPAAAAYLASVGSAMPGMGGIPGMGGMPGAEGAGGVERAEAAEGQGLPAGAAQMPLDMASMAQMAEQMSAAGGEMPTLPLKYIDGDWRIQLPFTFSEQQAELVGEALILAQDFLDKMTDKVESVDTLDQQTLMMMGQQTFVEVMPQAMELFARAQQVFGPAMGGLAEPVQPAEDEAREEGEEEEEAEDEPEPVVVP
jgi:hypothetical protein